MRLTFDSPWVEAMYNRFESYLDLAQRELYRPGETVYWQGDAPRGVYYLAKGRVQMSVVLEDGTEKILAVHNAPAHFGESSACEGQPHFTTVTAVCDSQTYLFSIDKLLHIAREEPQIFLDLMIGMARKMRLLTVEVETLTLLRAEQRLAYLLTKLANNHGIPANPGTLLNLSLTHQDLAGMTGMSRVTVTLIMNEWARHGIVSQAPRGHIRILDEIGLHRYVRGAGHKRVQRKVFLRTS